LGDGWRVGTEYLRVPASMIYQSHNHPDARYLHKTQLSVLGLASLPRAKWITAAAYEADFHLAHQHDARIKHPQDPPSRELLGLYRTYGGPCSLRRDAEGLHLHLAFGATPRVTVTCKNRELRIAPLIVRACKQEFASAIVRMLALSSRAVEFLLRDMCNHSRVGSGASVSPYCADDRGRVSRERGCL
jgi:hypothetical protein